MENKISVIGHNYSVQTKGSASFLLSRKDVSADIIQRNLSEFLALFSSALDSVEDSVGGFVLDEIAVNVSVSAEGSISLIGAIQAGTSGGITLKFKRNE